MLSYYKDRVAGVIITEKKKIDSLREFFDSKKIEITPEDFKLFWRRVNKFTLSSLLGIHYSHYKAAAQDKFSTNLLSQQLTIIARSGVPPKSWGVGLQLMLEKIVGIRLSIIRPHDRRGEEEGKVCLEYLG